MLPKNVIHASKYLHTCLQWLDLSWSGDFLRQDGCLQEGARKVGEESAPEAWQGLIQKHLLYQTSCVTCQVLFPTEMI